MEYLAVLFDPTNIYYDISAAYLAISVRYSFVFR